MYACEIFGNAVVVVYVCEIYGDAAIVAFLCEIFGREGEIVLIPWRICESVAWMHEQVHMGQRIGDSLELLLFLHFVNGL